MKICLYTNDMYAGTERLMPWRTLVEVAKYMNSHPGMEASIYSAQDEDEGERLYDSVKIHATGKGLGTLVAYMEQDTIDVLFFPVAFRDALKPLDMLRRVKAKKIAYIPGGIYPAKGIAALAKAAGITNAKPYVLEKLIPHAWLTRKLERLGFSAIVSFSETTNDNVKKCGWDADRAFTAIPGIDGFNELVADYSHVEKLEVRNRKYILFSGAPATIRGCLLLLKAFDLFAERDGTTDLVMLMRRDISSDFNMFNQTLNAVRHKERVIVSYDRIEPCQLKAFFESAYVVALPFLLIPSEIPLTFFEVLSCGTPVVTFKNGGSTDYIADAAVALADRTPQAFANELDRVCKNNQYRDWLAGNAVERMKKHPSWEDFAKQWVKAIDGRNV